VSALSAEGPQSTCVSALPQLQRMLHSVKRRTCRFAAFVPPSDSLYHQRNIRCEMHITWQFAESASSLTPAQDLRSASCASLFYCNICCVAVNCADCRLILRRRARPQGL